MDQPSSHPTLTPSSSESAVARPLLDDAVVKLARATIPYLWYSKEAAPMSVRAVGLSLLLIGGVPLGLAAVSVPSFVRVHAVRAEAAGFLGRVHVEPGDALHAGDLVIELTEPDKRANLDMMIARRDVEALRHDALEAARGELSHGMTGRIRLEGQAEPLSAVSYRKLILFKDRV